MKNVLKITVATLALGFISTGTAQAAILHDGTPINPAITQYETTMFDTLANLEAQTEETLQFSQDIFHLINQERINAGLQPLQWDQNAANATEAQTTQRVQAGQRWLELCSGNHHWWAYAPGQWRDHETNSMSIVRQGFIGQGAQDRAESFGVQRFLGEVISRNIRTATPESAVSRFMNSDAHRAILMNPQATHVGVGRSAIAESERAFGNWREGQFMISIKMTQG